MPMASCLPAFAKSRFRMIGDQKSLLGRGFARIKRDLRLLEAEELRFAVFAVPQSPPSRVMKRHRVMKPRRPKRHRVMNSQRLENQPRRRPFLDEHGSLKSQCFVAKGASFSNPNFQLKLSTPTDSQKIPKNRSNGASPPRKTRR